MTSDDHSAHIGGVHIGGNANVSGPVASGQHFTQTQHIAAPAFPPHLAETFDRLERLLDEHAAELAEPDKALRDLADVKAEAGEPAPDRDRISDSLNRLAHRVAAVAGLAGIVQFLMDQLLG